MQWWISPDWSKIVSAPSSQAISYQQNGWHGPFKTKGAAQSAMAAHNHQSGKSGKFPLTLNSTFGQVKNWIDSKAPGEGDVFIHWVETHAKVTPPESGTVDLSKNWFPAPPSLRNPNTRALNWFGAWLLLGNVGPEIAKILAQGIQSAAGKIPKILTGVGTGIGNVPGAQTLSGLGAIGDFFSKLGDPHTWLRVAEVGIGVVLLAIGLNALLKQTTGTSPVQVIGKIADKAPKVIPV